MVERKLYKTKLCVLYQRGHCPRQTCSFAHGNAELRRSFDGRQDNRGSDLREKLDRRHSPFHKYSPRGAARGRHIPRGDSPRSSERIRKRRKREKLDTQSDFSGSLRFSEEAVERAKHVRQTSSESKDFLDEQLEKAQSEINMLDDHKRKLEIYLEERIHEATSLNSRIEDLEMQLNREKEESKRITSKIKKFIKAYNRQLRLEDELKRSRAQLEKMTEQLGFGAMQPGASEEDPDHHTSGGEDAANRGRTSRNELQQNASPSNKRSRVQYEGNETSNQANPTTVEGTVSGKNRVDKLSRWSAPHDLDRKKTTWANSDWINMSGSSADQYNSRRKEIPPIEVAISDKSKVFESRHMLPSTSMAAHPIDEVVDIVEMDEKMEVIGADTRTETEYTFKTPPLPFPPMPPPPVPEDAYAQYKGDDENVDIEGTEEETVEVDIV